MLYTNNKYRIWCEKIVTIEEKHNKDYLMILFPYDRMQNVEFKRQFSPKIKLNIKKLNFNNNHM